MAAQPTIAIRRAAAAPVRRRTSTGPWVKSIDRLPRASIEDEAGLAMIRHFWLGLAGRAVEAIELAEQNGSRVARVGISVVRPRQVLLSHRPYDIGSDDDHQLGLLVDEVAALEQGAEHRQLHQARNAVDLLLGLLRDHAGQGERATGGNLDGRFGPAGLDRWYGERGLRPHADRLNQGELILGGQLGDLGHDLEADASLGQHHRREVETDAELLPLNRELAVSDRPNRGSSCTSVACRDRKLSAGEEARVFARDRRQVRFRQRADHAGALHRAQRCADGFPAPGDGVRRNERLSDDRERVDVAEIDHRGAETDAAVEIDAELLDDVALHLRDGHLEHDLVAAVDGDAVDDLLVVVDETRSDVERLLRFDRARDIAREHDAFAESLDADVQPGQRLLERRAQSVEIARHCHVETGNLLPLGVEEIDAGLARLDPDEVGAARGADDRVGAGGIAHEHVLDVARPVDANPKAVINAISNAVRISDVLPIFDPLIITVILSWPRW